MPRPRSFDSRSALQAAAGAFWRAGYAATSTETLLEEMCIGRQSLYNTFGDKRSLYLEALRLYATESTAAHIARLDGPSSPVAGLRDLLRGLAVRDDDDRARGCFGIAAVAEFGTSDPDVMAATRGPHQVLRSHVRARVVEALEQGDVVEGLDPDAVTDFILNQMNALQIAARGGASLTSMHKAAAFAVERLCA